ncbi:hypothetical protein [Bacillus sp. SD075]|nr:hypothetical protein [Bacillus sp. SD075]
MIRNVGKLLRKKNVKKSLMQDNYLDSKPADSLDANFSRTF